MSYNKQGIEDASGGGSDCGYSCEESKALLTQESITTVMYNDFAEGQFQNIQSLPTPAGDIIVTFNGVEYRCPNMGNDMMPLYGAQWNAGAIDWSEYPFIIATGELSGVFINTQTAGTYSVKIETIRESVITSECFEKARGYSCTDGWHEIWDYDYTNLQQTYGYDFYRQSVTPATMLPSTIKIEINSEEYVIEGTEFGVYGDMYYGAPVSPDQVDVLVPDFSGEYQFSIVNMSGEGIAQIVLYVPSDGAYYVTISEVSTVVTTTECFKDAVNSVVKSTFIVTYDPTIMSAPDKTFAEITEAINAGQTVVLHAGNDNDGWSLFPLVYYDASVVVVFTITQVSLANSTLYYEEYVIDSSDVVTHDSGIFSLTPSV